MIHQFYAVTLTSVYFVKDQMCPSDPSPFARKIALKGESRMALGNELRGYMLAVTTQLQMFTPEGGGYGSFERKIEMVNTRYWGGHSSPIVALFTTKHMAMKCFKQTDLVECDPRWHTQTKHVLNQIGDEHPKFEVCRHPGLTLFDHLKET